MDEVRGVSGVRRSVRIPHYFAIAVIGRDDRLSVELQKAWNNFCTTLVDSFHRLDASLDHDGVNDHVWIGEIQNSEGELVRGLQEFCGNSERAHLGLEIVGCDFG